tara:strand:+ start:1226 stop:1858 length:633 start_codon:yes stop_codon:yes gene_type:complete
MGLLAICDNDFLAKLTRFGLLNSFESRIRRERGRISYQPSIEGTFDLQNKVGSNLKLPKFEHRDQLRKFVEKHTSISLDDCGKRLVTCCYMVNGIDVGDAVWLAAAACDSNSVVYTHDKNALRAVAREKACTQVNNRLSGRVRCLEQEMLMQIDDVGFAVVRAGVAAEPEADKAMINAFCQPNATRAAAKTKLIEYIEKLRAETGNLLGQ